MGSDPSPAKAKEFVSVTAALGDMLATVTSKSQARGRNRDHSGASRFKRIFEQMPRAFQADKAAGVNVIFQFGSPVERAGIGLPIIKDGTCQVTPGLHEKPTTTIKMGDRRFPGPHGRKTKGHAGLYLGKIEDRRRLDEIPAYRKVLSSTSNSSKSDSKQEIGQMVLSTV